MSETLKMIVRELPRTMGELNHQLLYDDLKQALKEVKELEQQLAEAHRAAEESAKDAYRRGWEQCQREVVGITDKIGFAAHSRTDAQNCCAEIADAIASMEYKGAENDL